MDRARMKIVVLDGFSANPDVAQALQENHLHAYCADVMTEKPPKADNPAPLRQFLPHAPHRWASVEASIRLMDIATANVRAFLSGHPQNVIAVRN